MTHHADLPDWSGLFYQFEGERLGMMAVHVSDERHHLPPSGWTLGNSQILEEDDAEVFYYVRSVE